MRVKITDPVTGRVSWIDLPASSIQGQPSGIPANTTLATLEGWPHGPTSGLGGADWVAGCGTFRGEAYRMGPSFDQEGCVGAVEVPCNPSKPRGVWQIPWEPIPMPSGAEAFVSLTLPVSGRLFALEVCVTRVPLEVEDPCPCDTGGCGGCCDGACELAGVSEWRSRQIQQSYPGMGRETGTQAVGGGFAPFDPNALVVPACFYTAKRLLDGQNFLPPWVPGVDLRNGNDDLSWKITNLSPTYDIVVHQVLHIAYGGYDASTPGGGTCNALAQCGC